MKEVARVYANVKELARNHHICLRNTLSYVNTLTNYGVTNNNRAGQIIVLCKKVNSLHFLNCYCKNINSYNIVYWPKMSKGTKSIAQWPCFARAKTRGKRQKFVGLHRFSIERYMHN